MAARTLRILWGRRLREARKAAGLSQLQLAETLGTLQEQISRWERGIYAPVDEMRPRLAKALGVPIAELFAYPDNDANGGQAA